MSLRMRIGAFLLASSLLPFAAPAADDSLSPLSPSETLGKALFQHGHAPGGQTLRGSIAGIPIATASLACANCHGVDGAGREEARIAAPPLRRSVDARGEIASFDAEAIRSALASERRSLSMARYEIDEPELQALLAYLRVLGTGRDVDPGVTQDRIALGAVLPLSGPLERVGVEASTALRAVFERVNAQGGVYGRRIDLIVNDSQGSAEGTQAGIEALVEGNQVFSLVGSFLPPDSDAAIAPLAQAHVPLVGPVTPPSSEAARQSNEIYFLLPGLYDQARALIDYVAAQAGTGARVAVVAMDGKAYEDGAAGAMRQADIYPELRVRRVQFTRASHLSADISRLLAGADEVDYLVFFGSSASLGAVGQAMARAHAGAKILTSIFTAGDIASREETALVGRVLFAYPALARQSSDGDSVVRALALASAQMTVEALRRSGRNLTRPAFTDQLDNLREYATSVFPPISFVSRRHVGGTGVYVVSYDATSGAFTPVSESIIPRE